MFIQRKVVKLFWHAGDKRGTRYVWVLFADGERFESTVSIPLFDDMKTRAIEDGASIEKSNVPGWVFDDKKWSEFIRDRGLLAVR